MNLLKNDTVKLPEFEVNPVSSKDIQSLSSSDTRDWGWNYVDPSKFHEAGVDGRGVVIFVIDTGIDDDHEDLKGTVIHRRDWVNDGKKDPNGHGTWCASRIAGLKNNKGVVGIAPGAVLADLRVLNGSGSGSVLHVAEAYREAADAKLPEPYNNWVRVTSASLGSSQGQTALKQAVEYAESKGVINVAAAGNSGYSGKDTVNYPAKYDTSVIAVASIDNDEQPSSFSSGGGSVDVAAPGRNLIGAYRGGYATLSGTSMATPAVAAVAALLIDNYSLATETVTHDLIESYLRKYAKDIFTEGFDVRTGKGSVIVERYSKAPGDENDIPDEPDIPEEPENPTDEIPRREERELTQYLENRENTYMMYWKRQSDKEFKKLFVQSLFVDVVTDITTDFVINEIKKKVEKYFTNRGLILRDDQDFNEAVFWTGKFFEFIADDVEPKLSVTVRDIIAKDQNGNFVSHEYLGTKMSRNWYVNAQSEDAQIVELEIKAKS